MKYPALLLVAHVLVPFGSAQASDPKLRVKLSDESLEPGAKAKVRVRAAEDGYLVVLRMDTEGRVRIIYPVDPGDPGRVRGGKEFEVRSRGDREAFTVAERMGNGVVLAARADVPFRFEAFVSGNRWNGDAFTVDTGSGDAEEALLDLVDRMGDARYDYDAVRYRVGASLPRRTYAGGYYDPRFFGPAWGSRWNAFYDPWFMGGFVGSYYGGFAGYAPFYPRWGGRHVVYVRRPVVISRGGRGGRRR
jgi:hypothetical protein